VANAANTKADTGSYSESIQSTRH